MRKFQVRKAETRKLETRLYNRMTSRFEHIQTSRPQRVHHAVTEHPSIGDIVRAGALKVHKDGQGALKSQEVLKEEFADLTQGTERSF